MSDDFSDGGFLTDGHGRGRGCATAVDGVISDTEGTEERGLAGLEALVLRGMTMGGLGGCAGGSGGREGVGLGCRWAVVGMEGVAGGGEGEGSLRGCV